jgi:hypothetical protein
MASNIISTTIDEQYPVAGVDNDSQGFRDNFRVIKDSLEAARTEVSDLQSKVILKSALEGEDLDNNMVGTTIEQLEISQGTEHFTPIGSVGNSQNISFLNGHYQTIVMTADNVQLTLADWPSAGSYARMTIAFYSNSTDDRPVNIVGENSARFKTTAEFKTTYPDSTNTNLELTTEVAGITSDPSLDPNIFEFWTTDGGSSIYVRNLGIYS